MNPRHRKLQLRKHTVRSLTPHHASKAQGGKVIEPTGETRAFTNCMYCGGTDELTCFPTCHQSCESCMDTCQGTCAGSCYGSCGGTCEQDSCGEWCTANATCPSMYVC